MRRRQEEALNIHTHIHITQMYTYTYIWYICVYIYVFVDAYGLSKGNDASQPGRGIGRSRRPLRLLFVPLLLHCRLLLLNGRLLNVSLRLALVEFERLQQTALQSQNITILQ